MADPFRLVHGHDTTRRRRMARSQTVEAIDSAADPVSLRSLNTHRTLNWMFAAMWVLLLLLGGRLFQLQIVHGSDFRDRSEGNRLRIVSTPAPRGSIVDRNGKNIAENVPNIVATITPADLPKTAADRQAMILRISEAIHVSSAELTTTLQTHQRRSTDPVSVKEHISYQEAIQDLVTTAALPAVSIISLPNRSYPSGSTSGNVIGYTGRISPEELEQHPDFDPLDIVGKTGLERSYNDVLTGQDGVQEIERDVQNREQRVISQQEAQPGQTVVTSLDLDVQKVLSDKLQAMVATVHSPGGAAIAMDPSTGEIVAMASAPNYDDNWFVSTGHSDDVSKALTSPNKPLLNRAISGQYPSGSIIKPMIAAAALAERIITPATTVLSVGGFKVGASLFPDWKAGGHGVTNVTKALAESVNTFFYAVGGGYEDITGLGVDRIVSYLQRFGWGKKLGIDLPSEQAGFLPTKDWRTTQRPSPWKLGDTYHLSIGQGDLEVTPLQVATAISAIANGGTVYQPHLVTAIKNPDGTVIKNILPHSLATDVVAANILATVQDGMRAGVLNGSSRSLQSLPVTSAGKTGTAQFGNQGKTHSWYAAYAPYDHPKIVIAVIVEAGGEGNAAALPVAKETLQWYFTQGAGKP